MATHRVPGYIVASALLGSLCVLILASCGSSNAATASNSGATANATATACAQQFRGGTVSGTIQSITGNTLVINKRAGGTAQVTYSSTTRFTREALVAPTAVQEGTTAIVRVKKNTDNTYTATTVALTTGTTPFGANPSGTPGARQGQGAANNPCFSNAARTGTRTAGNGRGNFGGNFGGNGANGANGANGQTLNGTVGQVSSTSLTITDRSGNDYTVALTSSTQIVQTSSVSASTLQKGMNITANGMSNSQGVIAARTVAILLAGSNGNAGGQG